jgi:hypothetical protein
VATIELKAANMVARHNAPGFQVDLHHKDLGIVTAAARDAGGRHPARSDGSPADGCVAGSGERWPGSQRAAHAHRDAVRPSAGVKGNRADEQGSHRDRNAIQARQPA